MSDDFVPTRAKTLAVYLMCGPKTPELAEAAVEGGADLVELGFPFSDPLADGPVIRRAAERALARGMRTGACLDCLWATRERIDRPLGAAADVADGIVVGSKAVEVGEHGREALSTYVRSLRDAIDAEVRV